LIGFAPYGEGAIIQHVEEANGELCRKFGFDSGSDENATCKLDLLALQRRHDDLVVVYSGR
jgi:hypothetical protein